MKCCFSQSEVPTDKLFVLYYPPTMVHQKWEKSVYAAARARDALRVTAMQLRTFFKNYVVGKKLPGGLAVGAVGLVIFAHWLQSASVSWEELGFFRKYVQLLLALGLLSFGSFRLRRFLRRLRAWKLKGRETVGKELQEIEAQIAKMPEDPTAEQAAVVMRRECPDVVSELAFDGSYFHAFTYMDFVMFPRLKNPGSPQELPDKHSLNRDAYYVGDLVYDNWRLFQKDDRDLVDPRFVGSGGKRGVI
jgi:hypothetical protein